MKYRTLANTEVSVSKVARRADMVCATELNVLPTIGGVGPEQGRFKGTM